MRGDKRSYPSPNGVDNVFAPAFCTFAGIGNENRQLRVLIEDLFNAAIVATLLGLDALGLLRLIVVLNIAKVSTVGNVFWRAEGRGRRLRRRGHRSNWSIVLEHTGTGIAGATELAYIRRGSRNGRPARAKNHGAQTSRTGCYPRRPTWRIAARGWALVKAVGSCGAADRDDERARWRLVVERVRDLQSCEVEREPWEWGWKGSER